MPPVLRLLDLLGWAGAATSLTAYALNSLGVLTSTSQGYLLLNVVGCGLLIIYTSRKGAYANTTLNFIWLLVTLAALSKRLLISEPLPPPAPPMETIIDQLVAAYNTGNARAFADLFAPDAAVYEHPSQLTQASRAEIFTTYQRVFSQYPEGRTTVLHRIVIGNRVLDHERVQRSPNHAPFDVLTIYEFRQGLIQRLDFVREPQHIAPN